MALTDAQMTDARRYMGYQAVGTTMVVSDNQDIVYLTFGTVNMTLYTRLTTLTPTEESVITQYLTQLNQLELAIVGTSDNLDTDVAAVWTHNKNEQKDRDNLFDSWRFRLCGFVGCAAGPSLIVSNKVSR